MLTGRNLHLPCDLALGPTPDERDETGILDYLCALRKHLQTVHNFARAHLQQAFTRMKTRYDMRAYGGGFSEGQQVWLYNPARKRGSRLSCSGLGRGPTWSSSG